MNFPPIEVDRTPGGKVSAKCFATIALLWTSLLTCWSAERYVNSASQNPAWPYTNWLGAARTIHEAVDASAAGDMVLVTNGVYGSGGTLIPGTALTNRIAVTKPITVQSVNGPRLTIIRGNLDPVAWNNMRCVYLGSGAVLSGFTLTNGATSDTLLNEPDFYGGGIYCESTNELVTNCIIAGNYAYDSVAGVCGGNLVDCILTNNNGGTQVGGAFKSVLERCLIIGNDGAGASFCTLNNCILAGNRVSPRLWPAGCGGAASSTLNNCTVMSNALSSSTGAGTLRCTNKNTIIYYNGSTAPANSSGDALNYCCVPLLSPGGIGNISVSPLFVDPSRGNFKLQPNSPCINAGNNTYVEGVLDCGGAPRISGGTVDMGAYEVQNPASIISFAWLQSYRLPADGLADFTDPDGDGMNNWQEWRCGTDPTNAVSVLRLLTPTVSPTGVTLRWQSASRRTYFIERTTNFGGSPIFYRLAEGIPAAGVTTTYNDTNAPEARPCFYRVGVE